MRAVVFLLTTALLVTWIGVASAGLFPNGPNGGDISKTLSGTYRDSSKKRAVEDFNTKPFRNSWVVEFNDLITSSTEEFAEQHNVHVRRIGRTNKYAVKQKHATYGQDVEKQGKLALDPRVHSIEFQVPQLRVPRQIPTTDPGLCQQWHLYQCPNSTETSANINIAPAWDKGYTGYGIQIAIVDDGVETNHPDLIASYVSADSYDFYDEDSDPNPGAGDDHGTACAGLAVANSNTYCGVGGAYRANFAALRAIQAGTDEAEAGALSHNADNNLIYSNSWGPSDDGLTLGAPRTLTKEVLESLDGRGGKGSIFTWAGGNGRDSPDQTTKDAYASHPSVICVAATGITGRFASYSEPGASVFVACPGGDSDKKIYTTDRSGSNGYSGSECTDKFSGTSAATPIVSGAVALILEANPNLKSRDVRRILGLTAAKNDRTDISWIRNGANHWVNYNYGFGLIDVDKAVEAALVWKPLPALSILPGAAVLVNEPTGPQKCYNADYGFNATIEYISITVNIEHTFRGDMNIIVQSPSGTNVTLLFADNDYFDNMQWTFNTYFFMDEYSQGTWKVCFEDVFLTANDGTVTSFSLAVSGRPIENFVTTASLDATSPNPGVSSPVNLTITFSDDEGIFAASINRQVISVGEEYPVAVEIVSTTSTSVTARFTVDTSLPSYNVGSFDIKTTELSVQNMWLKYMPSDFLIGTLELTNGPQAPVAAPVATPVAAPVNSTPITNNGPVASNVPVATPARVSGVGARTVEIVMTICALICVVA